MLQPTLVPESCCPAEGRRPFHVISRKCTSAQSIWPLRAPQSLLGPLEGLGAFLLSSQHAPKPLLPKWLLEASPSWAGDWSFGSHVLQVCPGWWGISILGHFSKFSSQNILGGAAPPVLSGEFSWSWVHPLLCSKPSPAASPEWRQRRKDILRY